MSLSAKPTRKWFARTIIFRPDVPKPGRAGGITDLLDTGAAAGNAGACDSG
jgi:hypothetical protein